MAIASLLICKVAIALVSYFSDRVNSSKSDVSQSFRAYVMSPYSFFFRSISECLISDIRDLSTDLRSSTCASSLSILSFSFIVFCPLQSCDRVVGYFLLALIWSQTSLIRSSFWSRMRSFTSSSNHLAIKLAGQ